MRSTGDIGGTAFDLNIEEVLEHWTIAHAVREIIANALDEQVLTGSGDPLIEKVADGSWHVRDCGRGIRYEHLTQKENPEKLVHPRLIGKFGVGLKDALAVLHRHRVEVELRSRHCVIRIGTAVKHGFEIETLHAFITPPDDPQMVGTDVRLRGLRDLDVEVAKGFFLRFSGEEVLEETTYGSVLQRVPADKGRKRKAARIYINGLFVAEEPNFLFSYDITSLTATLRKALNRERTNVGRTAYGERVKGILLACRGEAVASLLAEDLGRFTTGGMHDELTSWTPVAVHACRILNAAGGVVFVTPDQLVGARTIVHHAEQDGLRLVVVPHDVAAKLARLVDLDGNAMRDLRQFGREWDQSFSFTFVAPEKLTAAERRVYSLTSEVLRLAGLGPKRRLVKEVTISETMRISDRDQEMLGLWEPALGRIVVRRSQLRSRVAYAATLLHELGHVQSGAGDVTWEFEDGLTGLLGTISQPALRR